MTGIEVGALAALFGGTAAAGGGAAAAGGLGATLAAAVPWIAGASAGVGAIGAIRQGNAAEANAKFEAKQMKVAGDQALAEGQQRARLQQRQGQLALGRARAMAAASGAGANETLEAGIIEQANYNSMVEFYGGKQAQTKFYGQAASTKASGKEAKIGGYINAASYLGKGATSIYDLYY